MVDEVDPVAGMSVVVVDDSRNFLKLVRSILRNFGVKDCTCFDDPSAALAYLEIHSVDGILMDLMMPKMNGFELAHKIRHSTVIANRLMPIILVTGHANRGNISKAINSGIDEVLVKPFRPTDLRKRLLAIATSPRRFIHTSQGYAGPDRRRDRDRSLPGADRRTGEDAREIDRGTGRVARRRTSYFDEPLTRDEPKAASSSPKLLASPLKLLPAPQQSDVFALNRRPGQADKRVAPAPANPAPARENPPIRKS